MQNSNQQHSSEIYHQLSLNQDLDYTTRNWLYQISRRLKELEDKGVEIQEGAVERVKMLAHRDLIRWPF